jgi:hypothetical protein
LTRPSALVLGTHRRSSCKSVALLLLLAAALLAPAAVAQSPPITSTIDSRTIEAFPSSSEDTLLSLPDSPGFISSSLAAAADPPSDSMTFQAPSPPSGKGVSAGDLNKYIQPGVQVPSLRRGDKLLLGFREIVSPISVLGWVTSAGWEQLINGSPNYGTNGKAFAQRLGAAVARDTSEGFFTDAIMSNVFNEDPRYYKMGKGHHLAHRLIYAATRPLITRTDSGRTTVNLAYLTGNLAGAALTQAYYPSVNHGPIQVLETFGGSLGGGAFSFCIAEFWDDALNNFHFRKSQ